MGTGVDHLLRDGAIYRWRRRVPQPVALRADHVVSRSLRTSDPDVARRRARACSARFDAVMLLFMIKGLPPTREQLAQVLDEIFRRVLDDGERGRAERPAGPPPWEADPLTDPRYEDVEPEKWSSVMTEPEMRAFEWRDSVRQNWTADVSRLVGDALEKTEFEMPRTGPSWRLFVRYALLAASKAYSIDAQRENGNYGAGWPLSCGIPSEQMPAFDARPIAPAAEPTIHSAAAPAPPPHESLLFSTSYDAFTQTKVWTAKTRKQGEAVMTRFISLMGDRKVTDITQSVAEAFKQRLRRIPAMNGKSIYAGTTANTAIDMANRIKDGIAKGEWPIRLGNIELDEVRARMLIERISGKTVNRELTFFTDWGKWMASSRERKNYLDQGLPPFAGLLEKKSDVEKESRRSGRNRIGFSHDEIALMLSRIPPLNPNGSEQADREMSRRWAVLLGIYSGMRLGEIAQLGASDFKRESGIDFFDLTDTAERNLKSEAGARRIPIHPCLLPFGLMEFARERRGSRADFILPRWPSGRSTDSIVASVSKWFLTWRKNLGIDSDATPFHSTRHTFGEALRASALGRDALVDQILGHEPAGVGAKVYTRQLPLDQKAALVASVTYQP